jgi:hypothetical protein
MAKCFRLISEAHMTVVDAESNVEVCFEILIYQLSDSWLKRRKFEEVFLHIGSIIVSWYVCCGFYLSTSEGWREFSGRAWASCGH